MCKGWQGNSNMMQHHNNKTAVGAATAVAPAVVPTALSPQSVNIKITLAVSNHTIAIIVALYIIAVTTSRHWHAWIDRLITTTIIAIIMMTITIIKIAMGNTPESPPSLSLSRASWSSPAVIKTLIFVLTLLVIGVPHEHRNTYQTEAEVSSND